ncbi:MAG: hypothetical protein J6X55_03755 [Victivallales bacterium]|nr:hypothetical protein [Victivallales bacterium]
MKRFLFDTWYGALSVWCGAFVLFLADLAASSYLTALPRVVNSFLDIATLMMLVVSGLLFFTSWIVSLVKKKWRRAIVQALLGSVCLFVFWGALLMVYFALHSGMPREDHFADNLTIPAELEARLVIPEDSYVSPFDSVNSYEDDFSKAIFTALERKGGDDQTVTCDLSTLADLVHHRRDDLMMYLARHPGWWLHEDGGRLCATRRLMNRGVWNHPLHGYYSGNWPVSNQPNNDKYYQIRTTIGFPNSPFWGSNGADHPAVSTISAMLNKGNCGSSESCERFGDKEFCVEVFEESSARERRVTNAVLAFMKEEFVLLKLPPDAAVRGPEAFVLRNGIQPGIYNLTLRINPGESGLTYLKAFEVTKGTRLSEDRLKDKSNERIGWSADPEEKFLYENGFTIYEGDWGKPYAARFEVWFKPDSGKPERKLMERICKIEGWQW